MRATIKDIASDTGFSVTTVSLVLNKKAYKIPESTKKQIMESAVRLNYRPNQLAVSLVKKRSKTIGLIVPDIGNIFFANMAKGIEEACRELGRTVALCNTNDRHDRDVEYINMLTDKGVDGIIFVMSRDSDFQVGHESIDLMEELKIPYILMDRFIELDGIPGVIMDHVKGGYLATKHLIDLGHTRIACVSGPMQLASERERLKGYNKALWEAGIEPDNQLLYEGDYTREGGQAAVDYLRGREFTAVFACNDASAFGVFWQLKKYGLCVPGDISVVGYDDVFYAEMLEVPLTTVRQPLYEMGMETVKRLIAQIKKQENEKRFIVFEPKLVIRQSTARRNCL